MDRRDGQDLRSSTSAWKAPPSTAVCLILG